MTAEEIFNLLKEKFGDSILEMVTDVPTEPIISVEPLKINLITQFLRDSDELQFNSLMNLSGVDDNNVQKVKNEDGSFSSTDGTLSVYYHLDSLELKHKITLKVSTNRNNPEVESVTDIWHSANWHEREAFDMFGIKFNNHPDLTRILMPYDWKGFPLRKDYENPEFYEGMKIPY
ncbi:MAG: NADH-quinone oxidoreductase subunit C [Bacteroidetes bacterium]|nr:NADH-quinone oxidoreductase subunit C [Bacteroidota bacterium]MBU1115451.1 NADH-quinone oxidoreductase subunit C [Bacteroidota bacterium]MBU1798506.1 NADH-quinone oxidoreductase subunit C [Bacteroidota bacterium]